MDILEEIVARKRVEVEHFNEAVPAQTLHVKVEEMIMEGNTCPSMRQALMTADCGIIAEFKRKSPSKGWIKEEGRAEEIPLSYQQNGAAALSILTDNYYFGGRTSFSRPDFVGLLPYCSLLPTCVSTTVVTCCA